MIQQKKQYKRQTRQMSDVTKQKISAALRGRKKSVTHCKSISDGLKRMWQQIPKGNNRDLH